jgi:L-ascorbate metabolism protein UlaG (beta-lactamase superfamily)
LRIVTDPFDASLGYKVPKLHADIVTVSHEHFDHNATGVVGANPLIMRDIGKRETKGVVIRGVSGFHDKDQGTQRGTNNMFVLEVDGIKVVHLGDLGHILTLVHLNAIGPVDILLIPVGGIFTIDAQEADEVVGQLKPKIVIPMHYKTPAISLTIDGVERFLAGKKNVEKAKELEIKEEELAEEIRIIVLEHEK